MFDYTNVVKNIDIVTSCSKVNNQQFSITGNSYPYPYVNHFIAFQNFVKISNIWFKTKDCMTFFMFDNYKVIREFLICNIPFGKKNISS